MDLLEPIPPALAPELRQLLQPGELLMVMLASDIRPDGQYGQSWFALTDERLLVLHPNGGDKPETQSIPLAEVQRVQTKNYVGNGALVVDLPEETVELVRFSQSAYYKFSGVPQAVEAALLLQPRAQEEEVDEEIAAPPPPQTNICQTCGRPLRPNTKVCPHCIRKTETFWRLASYIKPYKWIALAGFSLTVGVTVVGLLPALLNRILLDDVLVPVITQYEQDDNIQFGQAPRTARSRQRPAPLGSDRPVGHLYHARALINGTRTYVLGWLGQRVVYDLKIQIFNYLQQLSLSFYSQHSTGRIMTRVTSDTERLQSFITTGFQDMIIAILTLIGIGVALFILNWELAVYALLPTPLMVVGTLVYRKRIHWVFHGIWRRIAAVNGMLADTIPGVKVVKAFAQENREMDRFERRNADLVKSQMESVKMKAYFLPSIAFVTSLGSLVIWWFGGHQVLGNTLTVGELQMFITYMMQFYSPVRQLCLMSEQLESAATTAERVFEILDTPADVGEADGAVDPGQLEGAVEFRDVSFTYDGFARILDRVSFTVTPGEMIGIVGPSGSGKSTLVNLISRFFDATDGEVLIDGKPVKDLQQQKLRSQIGVVLQEPLALPGHHCREHQLRPPRRHPPGHHRRGPGGQRPQVYHALPRRLRHRGRRTRRPPLGGRTPAHLHRPGLNRQPPYPYLGRGHQRGRHRDRIRNPGGPRTPHRRPHHLCHRPSAVYP